MLLWVLERVDWLLEESVFEELLDGDVDEVLERVDWLLEESVFEELIDGDVEGLLLFVVDEDNESEEEALH